MLLFILFLFATYPFALLAVAFHSPMLWIGGSAIFVCLIGWFALSMKRRFIQELQAKRLAADDPRSISVYRVINRYAPDEFRSSAAKIRVYRYPSSESELQMWMRSRKRFDLFVAEGFFDRSTEADWANFLRSWSTLKWSMIRRQNRLHALKTLFDGWRGPLNGYRHWWVSFWLYPLERVLKISKI